MAAIQARGVIRTVRRTAAVLFVGLVAACSAGPAPSAVPSPTTAPVALQQLKVLSKIAIPDAFEIAEAFGSIWVGANASGKVVRINPATNAVVATVQVSTFVAGLVASDDSIWVIDGDAEAVRRIDPGTNTLTKDSIAMDDDGGSLAWFDGVLWQSGRGHVTRIDPATSTVATFQLPGSCADCSIAILGGQAYSASNGTVQRIDLKTHAAAASNSTDVSGGIIGLGPDGLWVGSSSASVAIVDPMTLKLRKTFTARPGTAGGSTWALGANGADGAIAATAAGTWLRFSGPVLGHVAPASDTIDLFGPFPLGRGGGFILADGSIWLLNIGDAPGEKEPTGVWRLAIPAA